MIPFLIAAVALVVVVAIIGGPKKENDTMREAEARLQREEALAAQRSKNEQFARELREHQRQVQEMKANQKRREEKIAQMVEQARVAARKVQVDEQKKKEEEERVAKQDRAIRKEQRELARKVKELEVIEKRLKDEVEKANQMAEQERVARAKAEKEFGAHRWPTREEFQHALRVTKYNHANYHFAIVGRAGSGKSSLINAFRNLRNKDPGAAQTGTKETTLEIGRYPDPGNQPPRQWMVWFDIPGAGTHRISHEDYFIKQGLYVFDLIVLAIGDRFEEIDARILENCARFKIPTFIVRSKADMHILNSMKEYGDYERIDDNPECYEHCQTTYIRDTQQTVDEEMTRQGLPSQPVYIVSRDVLQRTYNNSLQTSRIGAAFAKPEKNLIHESYLVKDMLTAAAQRRCDPSTDQVRRTRYREWGSSLARS